MMFLLHFFSNVPVTAVVSYCYHKTTDDANMMQNQSCITGKLHLNDNLVSTDYNSSERVPVEVDRNGNDVLLKTQA